MLCDYSYESSERIRSNRTSRAAPAPSSSALAIMEPPDSDAESEVKYKTSERIRSKRTSRAAPAHSSSALAVMEPPDSDAESEVKHSEESGAESDEEKADNEDSPQWKLLETIRNHPGPDGSPMSTAFLKLPSRRFYPDYYKEIKNPVSLNQIRNKIRRGAYGTLSEVAGDMNIMFENAKQYNINTSKLYKNAVKLQR
ncbi:hypothetical protein JYU34_019420 [Plutella xylostella]|uniref:Bromo domain-containing protein n=1 Tax=Plutella xylostella TaxID=51655 RepID=A0ABQ7PWS0_PLUXY|nr:hypothetical protein JYU34_019420 [Plutella xylostella]